ncbi:septum formation family protein [Sanguibacter suaedae]|uniref:Septum formation family protein n=1 Tax=Sanguibacter suaedae TaxID=2795737 RepID=A0A934IBX4_9MICO|nr:septum formation family protein [Sanguibacter suaedae]MBI9115850.1 septum formation family protein [Sanguibacter suaedae]
MFLAAATTALVLLLRPDLDPVAVDVESPTEVSAQQVVMGSCIEALPADGDVATVTVVPCDEEHDAQVVAAEELDGDEFPGDGAVREDTARVCTVDDLTLPDGDVPELELSVWVPSEASWDDGDRTGLCLASVSRGSLTVSLLD